MIEKYQCFGTQREKPAATWINLSTTVIDASLGDPKGQVGNRWSRKRSFCAENDSSTEFYTLPWKLKECWEGFCQVYTRTEQHSIQSLRPSLLSNPVQYLLFPSPLGFSSFFPKWSHINTAFSFSESISRFNIGILGHEEVLKAAALQYILTTFFFSV